MIAESQALSPLTHTNKAINLKVDPNKADKVA